MSDLDRFDRMLMPLQTGTLDGFATRPVRVERQPVITSTRGARYVDKATCPMCGVAELGVEGHGTLMTGVEVRTLAAHSPGMRKSMNGQPRCLGVGMRL